MNQRAPELVKREFGLNEKAVAKNLQQLFCITTVVFH